MEIVGTPVPDPTQFDPNSHYFDPKSPRENPRWLAIPVQHVSTWPRTVTLQELRTNPALSGLTILRAGNRLSITEMSKHEYLDIVKAV
jgi:predicted RNA-binding protein with PUA-like domain